MRGESMWEKLRKRHPKLCDTVEVALLVASIVMLAMAIDLYILVRGIYG